eukprot:s1324_g6.t4
MRYSKYVKKPLETSGNSACAAATILAQNQPASPAGWRQNFAGDRSALLHHAGNAFLVMHMSLKRSCLVASAKLSCSVVGLA